MSKASGGTRIKYPKSHADNSSDSMPLPISPYFQYDDKWEKTLLDNETGGFVVTSKERIAFADKSPNEKGKFQKEQGMCKDLAHMGFQIEHLSEISGISSPDIKIVRSPVKSIVKINGEYADLKALNSTNNIVRHAKDAIEKQGAAKVVFKFPASIDKGKLYNAINKLTTKGRHGIYYFEGETKYETF